MSEHALKEAIATVLYDRLGGGIGLGWANTYEHVRDTYREMADDILAIPHFADEVTRLGQARGLSAELVAAKKDGSDSWAFRKLRALLDAAPAGGAKTHA